MNSINKSIWFVLRIYGLKTLQQISFHYGWTWDLWEDRDKIFPSHLNAASGKRDDAAKKFGIIKFHLAHVADKMSPWPDAAHSNSKSVAQSGL